MDQLLTSLDHRRLRTLAIAVDLVAVSAGSMLALRWAGGATSHLGFVALYVAFVLSITRGRQMLVQRLLPSGLDSFVDATRACSVALLLALGTGELLHMRTPATAALELWLLTLASIAAARAAVSRLGQRGRRNGSLATPTLVVGAGFVGARVVRRLTEMPEYGLRPVGFLDADPLPGAVEVAVRAPVLGAPSDLADVVAATGARHVILAFASERDHRLVELVNKCRELHLDVSVVPRLYESMNERATLEHIGGLPLLSLKAVDPKGWQFALKHTFDRGGALLALISLSPVMLAIAAAVKLTSPGPIFFRQRRIGRDGREFTMLKFRTMWGDPSTDGEADAGWAASMRKESGTDTGPRTPDRRTAVGHWLRSTSLDELPQLLNVLRGDMSLVGPRPERPEFVEQFAREVHGYKHRHRVKSGITGWAQANGLRGQTSIDDRAEWDNHYIENWSLALELRTILLTLAEVFRFREDKLKAGTAAPLEPQLDPELELVDEGAEQRVSAVWFCGYCGRAPVTRDTPAPAARVCGECGQGLMLESRADAAPRDGEAFLVVDSRLTVQAVSQEAEAVLGLAEQDATDRPLAELLVTADSDVGEGQSLVSLLERVAGGDELAGSTFVRPRGTFGVRLRARVSSCGPPRAALVVFETGSSTAPTPRHLRLIAGEAKAAEGA